MDIFLVLLAIVTILLVITLMSRERKNFPPGPPGIPLLGNINDLKPESMLTTLRALHKQYGDLVSIRFFRHHLIFVGGSKTTNELLVKRGDVLGRKPYFFIGTEIFLNAGVFASSGQLWKEHRTFGITSLRNFGFGKRTLQTRIMEEIDYFLAEVDSYKGKPFDIQPLISKSIANVIAALVFGKRFELTDRTSAEMCSLLNEFVSSTAFQSSINFFPFLNYLPGDLFGSKKLKRDFDRIFEVMQSIVDEHRSTLDENNIRDYIDCFLLEQKKKDEASEDHTFTDKQLLVTVSEFFTAGMETTSTAIRWGILYLLHNPDTQRRMRKEIDNVVASGRFPSLDDKPKLPFCEAVCYEVLRIGNVAPTTGPHALKDDVTMNGYVIPKNATLFIDLDSINMDPDIFPDPFKFNPDRFMSEDGVVTGTEKIGSFSTGRRVCMGESMAKMELFLFMTSLVQRYEVQKEKGKPLPSLDGIEGLTYSPKKYEICLSRID